MKPPDALPSSCSHCKKAQSSLPEPLKRCAKCHGVEYCSRACQREDWKEHKKDCPRLAARKSHSLADPPKDQIIKYSKQTLDLLVAVITHPDFDRTNGANNHPTIRNLAQFVSRTWQEWCVKLCSARAAMELTEEAAAANPKFDGNPLSKQHLEECPNGCSGCLEWESFDREKYEDIITRNMTAALIVLDVGQQQGMFGGKFDFGDKCRSVAHEITDGKYRVEEPVGGAPVT